MFAENDGTTLWYLDSNSMIFRRLLTSDLPENRHEIHVRYEIPRGTVYANGAMAAMNIRAVHLEEQMKVLSAMQGNKAHADSAAVMLEDLEEELGFVKAYLADEDPKERELLTRELNEMYEEMRSVEEEKENVDAAAAK